MGVDTGSLYTPAVNLIQRLGFPTPHLDLIHAAPDGLPIPFPFGDRAGIEARYEEVVVNLGHVALQTATNFAGGKGLACEAHLVHGSPAERLLEAAKRTKADLIAIDSRRCGVVAASYINSLARALTLTSPTSVLITKGQAGVRGVFRAVFATDHSPFAERCLNRLLELAPEGLKEVHVVTAFELDETVAGLVEPAEIEGRLTELNQAACTKLESAGYRAVSHVRRGPPNETIHRAMADIRADLLIVGSQGGGDVSLVGSVTLHQVTAEFYPVLVLRPLETA